MEGEDTEYFEVLLGGKTGMDAVKRGMQDNSVDKKWKKRFKGIQVKDGGHQMVLDVSLIVYHTLSSINNLYHFPYCCG